MENTEIVKRLSYLVKSYERITKVIAQTRQTGLAYGTLVEDADDDVDLILKGNGKEVGMLTVKGRLSREIEKELPQWDVWERWLKYVPGIGPAIGAKLILMFNYRSVAVCKDCGGMLEKEDKQLICQECGKTAKDGLLKYRIERRDYATISKWWAYMGRHTVDGIMPKRKSGELANWSTEGRTLGFHIGDQFNRQKESNPYKALLLEHKAKHQRNHPEWSKGHVHNAAKNEVVKIFLAHFWTISRTLEGKEVSEPYAGAIMGHTNIIKPPFWEENEPAPEIHGHRASHAAVEMRV